MPTVYALSTHKVAGPRKKAVLDSLTSPWPRPVQNKDNGVSILYNQ